MLLEKSCPACSCGECLTHGINKAFSVEDILRLIDWSAISDDIREELVAAGEAGVDNATVQLDVDDKKLVGQANRGAADYAKERAAELVGRGDQSIAESTRDALRDLISASFEEDTIADDLIAAIQGSGIFGEARNKKWFAAHPGYRENYALMYKFGITLQDKQQMFTEQNGRCANLGCLKEFESLSDAHVDHDHDTDKIRALLCRGCNQALGILRESVERIVGLVDYLQKH